MTTFGVNGLTSSQQGGAYNNGLMQPFVNYNVPEGSSEEPAFHHHAPGQSHKVATAYFRLRRSRQTTRISWPPSFSAGPLDACDQSRSLLRPR